MAVLRFLSPEAQRVVVRAILNSDRLRREDAEPLGQELIKELGLRKSPSAGPMAFRTKLNGDLGHRPRKLITSRRFAERNHRKP